MTFGRADVTIPLRAEWEGDGAARGIRRTRADVKGLKDDMTGFARQARGALGFFGVTLAVGSLAEGIRGLGEEQATMARLERSIIRLGGTAEHLEPLDDLFVSLRRNSVYGDTEIAGALQRLISLTRDYTGSVQNLDLVLDFASDQNKSVQESTTLVAKAMAGQIAALGEMLPEMRKLSQENRELEGTAKGAEIALKSMRENFGGTAQAEVNSMKGSISLLAESIGELGDSIIERGFGTTTNRAIRGTALEIDRLAETIRDAETAALLAADALAALEPGASPIPGATVDAGVIESPRSRRRRQIQEGIAYRNRLLEEIRQKRLADLNANDPSGGLTDAQRLAQRQIENFRNLESDIAAGYSMGFNRTMFPTQVRGNASAELAKKLLGYTEDRVEQEMKITRLYEERQRLMGQELQSNLMGAFHAARGGVDGLAEYMQEKLITEAITNIAAALVNALGGTGTFSPLGMLLGLGGAGKENTVGVATQMRIGRQLQNF